MFVQIPKAQKRLISLMLAALGVAFTSARAADFASPAPAKNVAAIVTVYHHNSHADMIAGRLLRTDTLDGKGSHSPLKLVSLYTDQRPTNDLGRRLAASYGFRLSE